MKNNKIAVLGLRGIPHIQGGVETHCQNLYPHLAKMGWDITVFCRKPYVSYQQNIYQGIKLISLPCPRQKFLEAISHTLAGVFAAKKEGCSILHIHAIGPSLCVPIARLLGMQVLMTHHGPDYNRLKWGTMAKAILRLGEWLGVKFACKIIVISKVIQDHVWKKFHKESILISNGVNVQASKAITTTLPYHLKPQCYILAVGRLVPEKGFHDLLKAFENSHLSDWNLVIAGDVDHEDKYSRELKQQAKHNSKVIMTGLMNSEQLQELYSQAGLFVLPSYHEGHPIVLLEALSFGLPCLVSDIPANQDILKGIYYFEVGNIEDLRIKLINLTQGPINREERTAIIDQVKSTYSWERIAQQTSEVFKTLAKD